MDTRCNAAVDQIAVKTRHRSDHHDGLCDVGGNQLLVVGIRAVEQRLAWHYAVDDAAVITALLNVDLIAAGHITLLAARGALKLRAVCEFNAITTPETRHDLAFKRRCAVGFGAHKSNKASSFAAQIKSFSDRPLMAWVTYDTRHWL